MGNSINPDKTFYVIAFTGHSSRTRVFFGNYPSEPVNSIEAAVQYATITAALTAIAQQAAKQQANEMYLTPVSEIVAERQYQIIRVEEVPGEREVVITNRTKIDATKPCVLTDVDDASFWTNWGTGWCRDVNEALIFSDLQETLRAIHKGDVGGVEHSRSLNCDGNLKVLNVDVIYSPPTFIETVVQ